MAFLNHHTQEISQHFIVRFGFEDPIHDAAGHPGDETRAGIQKDARAFIVVLAIRRLLAQLFKLFDPVDSDIEDQVEIFQDTG